MRVKSLRNHGGCRLDQRRRHFQKFVDPRATGETSAVAVAASLALGKSAYIRGRSHLGAQPSELMTGRSERGHATLAINLINRCATTACTELATM